MVQISVALKNKTHRRSRWHFLLQYEVTQLTESVFLVLGVLCQWSICLLAEVSSRAVLEELFLETYALGFADSELLCGEELVWAAC